MSYRYIPPEAYPLNILYEDKELIVLYKPSGLLSVPGRGADKQDCLITRANEDYPDALIVHRLDMATSGIMVLARNKNCHRMMSEMFQNREVKKNYIAVVEGIVKQDQGEIDLPLITDWPNRPKQKIDHLKGKASTTYYTVLERNTNENCSRVSLAPITGRTHQLRVHMQSLGHPILGDNLYSNNPNTSPRLLLHANFLEFIHPISEQLISHTLDAPF